MLNNPVTEVYSVQTQLKASDVVHVQLVRLGMAHGATVATSPAGIMCVSVARHVQIRLEDRSVDLALMV